MKKLAKWAWYWTLSFKLAWDEMLFGRERMNRSLVRCHRELHKELFGELP